MIDPEVAAAALIQARLDYTVLETFPGAFACHFHQPEGRYFAHLGLRMVLGQVFLQRLQNLALMILVLHIDEIDNDDTAQIAQSELARYRLGGFHIGFEDGFFEVLMTDECPGININRGHGFGLIDNQVATGFQANLAGQCPLQLIVDIV